jgi:flagellar hook-basal body protein
MSFYTSLTGLNAATAMLGVTANNISNVGTTGFKRSRADFGDIFATSPLQKSSSTVGQGVSLKQVSQEFSQGNISFSSNALDLAITGDGFFPLRSADGLTDTYTRNGSFSLNEQFNVVNSAGQRLMAATVDSTGSANVNDRVVLTIPQKTSGEAKQTSTVSLGLNFPADAATIDIPFSRTNPASYNKSTAFTVYDNGGNGYLATIYYTKTQNANQNSPYNKWQTHVFVGEDQVSASLAQSTDINGDLQYVNQYGQIKSYKDVKDELTTAKTELISLNELTDKRTSAPASVSGLASAVDLSGGTNTFSGLQKLPTPVTLENLFTVNVDNSTEPVTVDLSYLKDSKSVMTGASLANEATKYLNKKFGNETTFNFSSNTGSISDKSFTITDSRVSNGSPVNVPLTLGGFADETNVSIDELTADLQNQVNNSVLGGMARQSIGFPNSIQGTIKDGSAISFLGVPIVTSNSGDTGAVTAQNIVAAKKTILADPAVIAKGINDITLGADGTSVILTYNQFPKTYFSVGAPTPNADSAMQGPTVFMGVELKGSTRSDTASATAHFIVANKKALLASDAPAVTPTVNGLTYPNLSKRGITDIQIDPTDPSGSKLMFVYDQSVAKVPFLDAKSLPLVTQIPSVTVGNITTDYPSEPIPVSTLVPTGYSTASIQLPSSSSTGKELKLGGISIGIPDDSTAASAVTAALAHKSALLSPTGSLYLQGVRDIQADPFDPTKLVFIKDGTIPTAALTAPTFQNYVATTYGTTYSTVTPTISTAVTAAITGAGPTYSVAMPATTGGGLKVGTALVPITQDLNSQNGDAAGTTAAAAVA